MALVKTLQEMARGRQVVMARELGISQPHLNYILSGRRTVSVRLARRLAALHPELQWEVAAYLLPTNSQPEQVA